MYAIIPSCTRRLLVKMISELVQMVQTLALGYMHSNRHCDKRGYDAKTMLHAAGSVRHILVDVDEEGHTCEQVHATVYVAGKWLKAWCQYTPVVRVILVAYRPN